MNLAHGMVLESFDLTVELRSDDRDLLELVPDALPIWRRRADGEHRASTSATFSVLRNGILAVNGVEFCQLMPRPAVMLPTLETAMRHHLALHAPHHVFIHAGVIGVDGVGVVIPGSSFTGKTTLVAELVRNGATYYSDEYAVVDRAGQIHPYARPLALRAQSPEEAPRVSVSVPDAQIGREPMRAGLIAVTSFEPGAQWHPVRSSPGEGAMALFNHAVPARSKPERALAAVRAVAQDAVTLTGTRGEASEAVAEMLAAASKLKSWDT